MCVNQNQMLHYHVFQPNTNVHSLMPCPYKKGWIKLDWNNEHFRKLFEEKVIVMWSADNDLLNLEKDYGLKIPYLVDLQSKYPT